MTRKHFEAIAAVMAKHRSLAAPSVDASNLDDVECAFARGYSEACGELSRDLADDFAMFNPNFNRARFLKACGIEE